MLPVSSWPPGPPGSSLSPFGRPRQISVDRHPHGFVIPKGAWVVRTTSNSVVMFAPPVQLETPGTPGTGLLPGSIPPRRPQPPPCPPVPCPPRRRASVWSASGQVTYTKDPTPVAQITLTAEPATSPTPCPPAPCPPAPRPKQFMRYDDYLEAWRAWQRRIGRTDPPIRPLPGRRPPNWFGWRFERGAPGATIVPSFSAGTVLADGQNVVIGGSGFATITQAYSV